MVARGTSANQLANRARLSVANEPRCLSAGVYPRSNNCTTQTLVQWANDMSTFVKTIDTNHLDVENRARRQARDDRALRAIGRVKP